MTLLAASACSGQGSQGPDVDAAVNPSTGYDAAAPADGEDGDPPDDGPSGEDGAEGLISIEGELIECPSILVLVAPAVVRVGESAYLSAEAEPQTPGLLFRWSSSDGEIADPSAAVTRYRCTSPGEKTLQVMAWEGPCSDVVVTGVTCEPAP